jgi:hypothetical protein
MLLAARALAQRVKPSEVEDALNRLKQGKFFLVDVGDIARAHMVEAIPILKDQFGRVANMWPTTRRAESSVGTVRTEGAPPRLALFEKGPCRTADT